MRHLATVTLLSLLAAPSIARADEPQASLMTSAAANAKPCAAIAALPNAADAPSTCKRVATQKIAGLGTAEIYALPSAEWTRYALVIVADDGGTWASEPVDLMTDCSMGGKCDNLGTITPKLRAITIGGAPAAALELHVAYTHVRHDMDSGKLVENRPWQQTAFVACGHTGTQLACVNASYGTAYQTCNASLDPSGTITHRCDETTELTWTSLPRG